MSGLLAALGFLTRAPVPGERDLTRAARAQAWFPVVGLVIGVALLGFDRAATRALSPAAVAVLDVLALAAITGGLHIDGLADAADGLLGGGDPARRREIMRDPHIGSFGVLAIVAVLAMKFAGVAALPASVRFEALLLAPCVARAAVLAPLALLEPAHPEGLGRVFRDATTPRAVAAGGAFALVATFVLLGAGGFYVAVAVGLAALAMAWGMARATAGMSGDLAGATIELSEAFSILLLAALANRGWIAAYLLG
jgi:adenosylcobinamide-GDP ribazoletransferase